MVVYAEVTIPAEGFVIGRAFSALPDVHVEMERIVPTVDAVVPFIWVRGADPEDVVRVTRAYEAVERITLLDDYESAGALFRVVWRRAFRDVVVDLAEADVVILSGTGTAREWHFELRARSRDPLSAFRRRLRDEGVPVTLERVTDTEPGRPTEEYGLTDAQREAIRLAFERGYFKEPHETTLEALADEVGISRQSFGGRLRRGLQNLVANTLPEGAG